MDELASTEFRKRFARLKEPIIVTANGHPIGEWIPATWLAEGFAEDAKSMTTTLRRPGMALRSQTQRDELLRKINKG
jgi:hypothetical protein